MSLIGTLVVALASGLLGALATHALTSRRWRMEARKDAYIEFVERADAFVAATFMYRDVAELGNPTDYVTLRKRLRELRPAYYALRLLARAEMAAQAERIWVDSQELLDRVHNKHPAVPIEERQIVTGDEYLALRKQGFGPWYEDVDEFVTHARIDLTADSRIGPLWFATLRKPRWLWRRLRTTLGRG